MLTSNAVSIRFFRSLIGLQEEFYVKHLIEKQVLRPVLEVLIETMPRDNLLSSASLELFEFIKKENMKDLVKHVVTQHRDLLMKLSHLPTFREIILRYEQTQGYTTNMDYFLDPDEEMGRKRPNTRLMEHLSVDPVEEEYWNTSDPEDEAERSGVKTSDANGASTPSRPLVDYESDEEVDESIQSADGTRPQADDGPGTVESGDASGTPVPPPPERLAEKRRREEDEDDELGKLLQNKKRNSSSSGSNSAVQAGPLGRRRKSFTTGSANGGPKKIAISLGSSVKSVGDVGSDENS